MILNFYESSKEKVLSLYDSFRESCSDWGKEVSEGIRKQAESIRNENFNLMVLGEAKSGKSTFINAFIQEEILPMDVRQCTSSIIKLHKGDECKLEAKTAGGGLISYSGVDKVKEFLKKHAAISDKYRSIPITTINNELLIKTKGNPREYQIKELLDHVKKDNIYSLKEEEYNNAIKNYIEQEKNNWRNIVTEIDITYPLPEYMKGITLIDSPGVSAGGNVGIIAENYIKNANAIIFVKSLNGQALESSTFMNFLETNCTDRKKELLFLVLTGTSNLNKREYKSLKEQALEMYSKKISAENIICVDSKVELVLNKCLKMNTVEKIESYFEELEENGEEFEPAVLAWLISKDDINKFKGKMEETSNFAEVEHVLDKFARQVNYLRLIEFIDNLKVEYEQYKDIFKSQLEDINNNMVYYKELRDIYLKRLKSQMDIIKRMTMVSEKIYDILDILESSTISFMNDYMDEYCRSNRKNSQCLEEVKRMERLKTYVKRVDENVIKLDKVKEDIIYMFNN